MRSSGSGSAVQYRGSYGAQIELWSGNPAGAERELVASSRALEEYGAGNSAVTHRALLAEVLCALEQLDEAEALANQVAEDAPIDDLILQVLWRSALCRVRSRRAAAGEVPSSRPSYSA